MEIASIIIAALALLVSIASLVKSSAASKTANDLTKGQVEMQIRSMITVAKAHFSEMSNQLAANPDNPTYDEACAKYLDGKVDKQRFKQLYVNEIRNWVDSEAVKDKYIMPQSRFHATVKVYDEWNNLER